MWTDSNKINVQLMLAEKSEQVITYVPTKALRGVMDELTASQEQVKVLREGLLEAADLLEECDSTLCGNAGCDPSQDHIRLRALATPEAGKDE